MDTLSRLKGIETLVPMGCGVVTLRLALDTLSRLKGIETLMLYSTDKTLPTLDTLSRLKGIETSITSGSIG